MMLGNKKTIGFDFLGKSGKFINMNVFVGGKNISFQDNSYYIYPLILNLKKEIEFFTYNELSLREGLGDINLSELYNLFFNDKTSVYKNSEIGLDILFFDLSVKRAFFYAYQEENDLIIFGKFFENDELISTRLKKSEYIDTLNQLLSNIDV
ncbi:hypothetical protein [Psychrobacter sp. I-STPA6b]|uniref:hypothetical protein n=1 Tax=Psychrobacter sp. I-STPA6b TaxID=2585718 RepID=UPI001D0CBFA3|nr:hypothetical protein [Psychrobacter sp. I-STPA6b]